MVDARAAVAATVQQQPLAANAQAVKIEPPKAFAATQATEWLTAGSIQNCRCYLPAVQWLGRRALQFPNREIEGIEGVWGIQAWGWA